MPVSFFNGGVSDKMPRVIDSQYDKFQRDYWAPDREQVLADMAKNPASKVTEDGVMQPIAIKMAGINDDGSLMDGYHWEWSGGVTGGKHAVKDGTTDPWLDPNTGWHPGTVNGQPVQQPLPPSLQEGAGVAKPSMGSFTLSPGDTGMWSMNGGKPGSVSDILNQIATTYAGQAQGSGAIAGGGSGIGVPPAGQTRMGGIMRSSGGAIGAGAPIGGSRMARSLAFDPSSPSLLGALGLGR